MSIFLSLVLVVVSSQRPEAKEETVRAVEEVPNEYSGLNLSEVAHQEDARNIRIFYAEIVRQNHEAEWYKEAKRQADVQAAQEAEKRRRATVAVKTAPTPQTSTGSHSGPHSDAWWHGVAICEQGGRNDPYYGYFSWMDGSAAGMTWDQQVAKSNALLRSVGHEVGPWAASCVAAGYRASPSG